MPLKEIAVHAGQEVLMEVDDNILLIVGDSQWILVEKLELASHTAISLQKAALLR